jgi:hypothetical protein
MNPEHPRLHSIDNTAMPGALGEDEQAANPLIDDSDAIADMSGGEPAHLSDEDFTRLYGRSPEDVA